MTAEPRPPQGPRRDRRSNPARRLADRRLDVAFRPMPAGRRVPARRREIAAPPRSAAAWPRGRGGRAPPMAGIFAGLRVIDAATYVAGPSAATILGDFGA